MAKETKKVALEVVGGVQLQQPDEVLDLLQVEQEGFSEEVPTPIAE